jgi:2-phospho-L-lactate/phosphoenolpyruvate guanylyltransferase
MIVVAVPVKDLVNAKQRLVRLLTPRQRMDLARTMLRDVLQALAAARLDAVWVVTRDAEVAALAQRLGAEILPEDENRGHTGAVARAQAEAVARQAQCFLTIPGDVPCVTAEEIASLAAAALTSPAAVFAPSRSGRGTNGVALAPANLMPLTFGEPSFENHLAVARRHGLQPRVEMLSGLALDVDGPDDIAALVAEGGATESARLLATWNITSHLDFAASSAGFARASSGGRHRKGGAAPLRG